MAVEAETTGCGSTPESASAMVAVASSSTASSAAGSGVPSQLLGAYQRQHRLRDRFDQVLMEISDFNRLNRETEKRYVNNALVLFTLITVPASGVFARVPR
jgi:hypothetical protein